VKKSFYVSASPNMCERRTSVSVTVVCGQLYYSGRYQSWVVLQEETAILWNDLPQEVRDAENLSSFKRLLKTHFFNSAFP